MDALSLIGVSEKIDDSHKYTDVLANPKLTAGGAHSQYAIKDKNGKLLGHLNFQDGPIKEVGVNGCMDENLIAILIDRLSGFQTGNFKSYYNSRALIKLEEALHWLQARTADREKRKVEGTHNV